MRLLLVEDDHVQAQQIQTLLQKQHYVVDWGQDCQTGLDFFELFCYDLILLDVTLPDLSGITFCQTLRQRGLQTPILLLTASADAERRIQGLDAGADDYVLKSADASELLARIRVLLRRPSQSLLSPQLHWGALTLDLNLQTVSVLGTPVILSPREYRFVELFLRNPQRVWSREALLEQLWSWEDVPSEGTIRTHIKRLRQKLAPLGLSEMIETVHGVGYRLRAIAPPASGLPSACCTARSGSVSPLCPHYVPQLGQRLLALEALLTPEVTTAALPHDSQVHHQVHQLAGTLGVLGLTAAYHTAQALAQHLLQGPQPPPDPVTVRTLLLELRTHLTAGCTPEPRSRCGVPPHPLTATLLWVDADPGLPPLLAAEAQRRGYQLHLVQTLAALHQAFQQPAPDVMIIDCCLPDQPQGELPLLLQLSPPWPHLPILVYSHFDQLSYRAALQHHSHGYLSKRVPLPQVFEVIAAWVQPSARSVPAILVVDEEPSTLQQLQAVLPPWEVALHGLRDPRQFWETLHHIRPQLLILAAQMPYYDGLQLCQIVRHDPLWQQLPIILLTMQSDPSTLQLSYQSGADNVLSKPIDPQSLKLRIASRLGRRFPVQIPFI